MPLSHGQLAPPGLSHFCISNTSINGTMCLLAVCAGMPAEPLHAEPGWIHATSQPRLTQVQPPARTASPLIGSAMAVLATLQDADVLPPEGTPEANRIIRFVIQFQSAFAKSDDAAVQDFLRQAVAPTDAGQADDIANHLRRTGWTADILEQLSDEEARRPPEELHALAQGLAPFNLSVEEFHRFMQLVRDGRQAFRARGLEFRNIFSSRRKEMPGGGSSGSR